MEAVYRKYITQDNSQDLIFQAREWYSTDYAENEDENKEFHIYCFGSTKEGCSVAVDIIGFTPFFFLKVPMSWENHHVKAFERWIKNKIGYMENGQWINQASALISCKLFRKKETANFRMIWHSMNLIGGDQSIKQYQNWGNENDIEGGWLTSEGSAIEGFECAEDCQHCYGDDGSIFPNAKGYDITNVPSTTTYNKDLTKDQGIPWIRKGNWDSRTGMYKPKCM